MLVKGKIGGKYTMQLVKWEGEAPDNWKEIEKPQEHPKCIEISSWGVGKPRTIIYKRD